MGYKSSKKFSHFVFLKQAVLHQLLIVLLHYHYPFLKRERATSFTHLGVPEACAEGAQLLPIR